MICRSLAGWAFSAAVSSSPTLGAALGFCGTNRADTPAGRPLTLNSSGPDAPFTRLTTIPAVVDSLRRTPTSAPITEFWSNDSPKSAAGGGAPGSGTSNARSSIFSTGAAPESAGATRKNAIWPAALWISSFVL